VGAFVEAWAPPSYTSAHIRVDPIDQHGQHAVGERVTSSRRLQTGSELGAYRLETLLGAGGMGEVYRAKDVRLGRWVAIKVLLPEISVDLEARRRFEREARAIANLNHPNICTLHDIGSADGVDYIVMEYLERDKGETARWISSCETVRVFGAALKVYFVFRNILRNGDCVFQTVRNASARCLPP
jgi:hypothetical protein